VTGGQSKQERDDIQMVKLRAIELWNYDSAIDDYTKKCHSIECRRTRISITS
jgi:hypothetical protein